jgi:hypothetical protein
MVLKSYCDCSMKDTKYVRDREDECFFMQQDWPRVGGSICK